MPSAPPPTSPRAPPAWCSPSPGLSNIVALVEQGRTIYQRILTWIINKISRTLLKSAFVAIAFLLTGKFVISAFAMLLLTFMTDFAKIALATDHVRPSRRPESWAIGGFVTIAAILGLLMASEALALLWWAWPRFGLAGNDAVLYTFSFLLLLYLAVFSIVSARERRHFWATRPSSPLLAALLADAGIGTVPDLRRPARSGALAVVADPHGAGLRAARLPRHQ